MHQLLERLSGMVREFIDQRDDFLLAVAATDHDAAPILQTIRDFDRHAPSDLVLLFHEPFPDPTGFLDAVAARLKEEVVATNAGAGPDDLPLPFPPALLFEPDAPPLARLRTLLEYARSLIDPRGGQRFVVGMVPERIDDPAGWEQLLAAVPRTAFGHLHGGRVIVRVPAAFDPKKSPLAAVPRVRCERFEIPHDAHEQGLLALATNPAVPVADRMQAEVQLGFIDAAHGRFDEANARFRPTLAFFRSVQIPALEGLVQLGLGDVARRQMDFTGARKWYESALVPASEAGSPILMASLVQHLAAIDYQTGDYAAAAERYGQVADLRRAMFDEDGLVEALQWQGYARDKAGQTEAAVVGWFEAGLLCRTFGLHHRLPDVLTDLKGGYERLGWQEALDTFDEAWGGKVVSL
jgi:hypothetical protein